ncbi:carnitine dehydratase [Thermoplasma sp. Kam2015]|uniref:CaiB/BaiF CoA transferase family protein n=1 Tax=Thermoplasma sp. Kam2015 TaxID=2094122 RepID=UPI000D84AAA4|nr:CaiB/BaiF CoA-transferase family protein [Thermoplasma sp. Kam2015]PYB68434.1 carnitine dehydratase [Thermoplasma sp. Kam2015]
MRVLEIGHIVAGPTAGLLLSDMGFEVIKIERPGSGDIARSLTGSSAGAFPFYNRGKKSITIDLKSEDGRKIFLKLVSTSSVIIDNLGYGAMDSLGLSYERIADVNPRIVYLSIRGYGDGPYERRKSLDYPIEVHSGLAYMTGLTGRPMRVGASIVDMGAAMFGVMNVMNALSEVERTGKGKKISVGLFETSMFFVGQHIATYQITGQELKPINEEGFAWGIYDFFKTKDLKDVFVAVTTDEQWRHFCSEFSLDIQDKYPTNKARYENRKSLIPYLQNVIGQYEERELIGKLEKSNISYATLNRPWDLISDVHASRKMARESYNGKDLYVPTSPLNTYREGDPPSLGRDNDEILADLGYSREEIDILRRKNVI